MPRTLTDQGAELIANLADIVKISVEAGKEESAEQIAGLTARVSELEGLFAAVDDKDWQRLDSWLGYSAHGQFWREIFGKIRAALPPIPDEVSHD